MARVMLLVIDGLGCGAQEDSPAYGDADANTLAHVLDTVRPDLPHFRSLGLGNIIDMDHIKPVPHPLAAFGKMRERSAGKDSTTGHWEMAGIVLRQPFPTFPSGFPDAVIEELKTIAGTDHIVCNRPYSGSEVIRDYGDLHLATGYPILYTSADSVLQIAAHVDVVQLETLYSWCQQIRDLHLVGDCAVGRVIARPFAGSSGNFHRLSDLRKDFSLAPPEPNLLTTLRSSSVKTQSIGKVVDLFGGQGFDEYRKTLDNSDGLSAILEWWKTTDPGNDLFQFVNLIDTDQLYGHRNDPIGYANALEEIDRCLPLIMEQMRPDDVLILTGDHGNDPTTPGTDHTREFVPLLVYPPGRSVRSDLGTLDGFSVLSWSIIDYFTGGNSGLSILKTR